MEVKIFDTKVIDETRWELLKLWHGKEAVYQWDRTWERTTTWELEGGRTLDWTLTTGLLRESVLFIGTQFSNLCTRVDTPAETV